uniref:Uncharacterized protein n=1 Tax=Amphora coffeiformis TaxID=265554 RepID=A0A7S3LA61_9STRA
MQIHDFFGSHLAGQVECQLTSSIRVSEKEKLLFDWNGRRTMSSCELVVRIVNFRRIQLSGRQARITISTAHGIAPKLSSAWQKSNGSITSISVGGVLCA